MAWAKQLRQAEATTRALRIALSTKYGKSKPIVSAAGRLADKLSKTKCALDGMYFDHPEIKPLPNSPDLFIYYGSATTAPSEVIIPENADVDVIATYMVEIYQSLGDLWGSAMGKMLISSASYRAICATGKASWKLMSGFAADHYEVEKTDAAFPYPKTAYGWG